MDRNYMRTALFWGYYVASSGNFLPAFWANLSVPSSGVKFLTPEDELHCTKQLCYKHTFCHNVLFTTNCPYISVKT